MKKILFTGKNKTSTSTKDKSWQLDFFHRYAHHRHGVMHLCCNQVCSIPGRVHKWAWWSPTLMTGKRSSLKKLRLQQFEPSRATLKEQDAHQGRLQTYTFDVQWTGFLWKMLTITSTERLRYARKMRELFSGLSPISFLFFYVYIQPE